MGSPLLSLNDVAFDGASCVTCYFGSARVNPTEVTLPKQEQKREKVPRIGEPLARKRTMGRMELGNLKATFEIADYVSIILPRYPIHSATTLEFPMTVKFGHPAVNGSLGVFLERCAFVVWDEIKIGSDEKAVTRPLEIQPMRMWEKGADGKLRSAAALTGELAPSLAINLTLSF